jgi:hypothetical protein
MRRACVHISVLNLVLNHPKDGLHQVESVRRLSIRCHDVNKEGGRKNDRKQESFVNRQLAG